MINQRARVKMDPSVASTTKIHRAGLSTITGLTWAVRSVDLSWTTTGRVGSEGSREMNYFNQKKKTVCILNSCKNQKISDRI